MAEPRHPKARFFVERDLFDRLSSFSELQARISTLSTDTERGAAFEVFAEAYFATQPLHQASDVWPFNTIPLPHKQRLGLGTSRDMGVDGIFKTRSGVITAYQVKFRSGRPSLQWAELSTFMGLADKVSQRVLFTNCVDLPKLMNERRGFYCIRGGDLDRLQPSDFDAILGWLRGGLVRPEKKEPLPHQQQAFDAILAGLRAHDRVTTVMACGTGKTLVQLWLAERLSCQNVLVLVPSLALLRQTLHEWLRETRWERIAYLAVCSDPTVNRGMDDLVVRQSELDFPVTTDSKTVRAFLGRETEAVKVVFSTYQSAREVARGMRPGDAFDLALFDEAHRTAGREGGYFSFALKDTLAARKRVFLTATPRHYDVRHQDKEGDARLVYSMDAVDVYGPVVHNLSFAEAAKQGIICNYKVIISVVTTEMVNDELLRRGEVVVRGDVVKARQVANQIALQKAVERYGVTKMITFHRSVKSAASFTAPDGQGVQSHLPGFEAYHVNGRMAAAERDAITNAFGEADRSVISNARCLTEGVNVPAVDLVAFLAPRRSRIDIVQATGRAMRPVPGKTTGYVFLPLFLEEATGESVENAVERGDFDEIWTVLQAMQEHDASLAEIIRQMRQERGRAGGFDDSRFREKVEVLGPELSLEFLREAITTRSLDRLGSSWDARYGELQAYRDRFGHCNVPRPWPENPRLGQWVHVQRREWVGGRLSAERIRRLEHLGFVWGPWDAMWEKMFSELVEYKSEHGSCAVPTKWPKNPELGGWVARQRNRRDRLSEGQIRRLDGLDFVWDMRDEVWETMFGALVRYKNKYGHCNVPQTWPDNPALATWVNEQRKRKRRNRLSVERMQRLEALGFTWEPLEGGWEGMFTALVEYKNKHGDCNVPVDWPENPALARWVYRQRKSKNKRMSPEQIQRLDDLGFAWDPRLEAKWEEMLSALVEFKKKHGHCNVPLRSRQHPKLGHWVMHQRVAMREKRLSGRRIKRLKGLGFVWDPADAFWEKRFSAMIEYKREHGHCNVPNGWPGNPKLAAWIQVQRRLRRMNNLSADREGRLENLGLVWNPYDVAWERMFSALVEYKKKYGDCNVPARWTENRELGSWVASQRSRKKEGTLREDRIRRLKKLGFQWQRGSHASR